MSPAPLCLYSQARKKRKWGLQIKPPGRCIWVFEIHLASFGNCCKYKVWIVCKYSAQGRCIPACVLGARASICRAEGSFEQKASALAPLQLHFFHSHFLPFFARRVYNRGERDLCLSLHRSCFASLLDWAALFAACPNCGVRQAKKRIGSQGDAEEQIVLSVRGTCFIIMNSRRTHHTTFLLNMGSSADVLLKDIRLARIIWTWFTRHLKDPSWGRFSNIEPPTTNLSSMSVTFPAHPFSGKRLFKKRHHHQREGDSFVTEKWRHSFKPV